MPFCKTKCPYCGFYSTPEVDLIDPFIEALLKEISLYEGVFDIFDSIYIGGGTPSLLNRHHIEILMETVCRVFPVTSGAEVTIEANPDDIDPVKIKTFKEHGINRLSLGIQSFHDGELSFLKRRHTSGEAERAIILAKSHGFENIGIDLIFAIPGQTKNTWHMSLEKALSFEPAHISCYALTIEEGTPFNLLKSQKRIKPFSEKKEVSFYLHTSQYLRDRGYIHYEVSNFAKGPKYYSRHNRRYWQRKPYLGLGPSAHSFKEKDRWWNIKSIKGYMDSLARGIKPVEAKETLTEEQIRLESIMLGLRTEEGVDLGVIASIPRYQEILENLLLSGYVEIKDGRAVPTVKGYLMADGIAYLFS
ncbi:MAG: radical SAM family heme chaperone HemW [Syntrophorhabdaceae bacterium]|nr:radical SAM family heme chaperone HemW [Syntrophorhabdaceae bacterium]